ncbi:hypothetical protein A3A79_00590 [Candidatus Gottesmanbacteria bacterium RIFCSPLOWO2_01_FULL_43_11b]|uniref:DNA polymerase III delta N-terminal domain-containing protein n=1 Tax=Candidatus Gottesmanbacteria bacterium RIFCSPLOWO2_01_FULL_43_11b TaxID=1798392 RepID=A0A1F6AGX6_9BACT|nr:MAG: hypothetical protein A3A79_00590 [Candidatus Gottesmanbacteria bacterium RIFCSPLOWO2_01_FULL_43_11b]
MHTFLYVGATKEKRKRVIEEKLREWKIQLFDRVIVEPDVSIGIGEVRELEGRLKLKPYTSPFTVVIIYNAEKLTIPAQHALLKTLEEPPPHARIILETAHADVLLPTILSRAEIINLGELWTYSKDELHLCFKTLEMLQKATLGERFTIIDGIAKTREEAVLWVDLAIAAGRDGLLVNKFPSKLLRGLLVARQQLSVNVNPKLVLDNLFLP